MRFRPHTVRKPVDPEDHIVAEIRCLRCGAPLRGQSVTGECSNCRHPCSDSVYGDYLIYSDRAEVDRLHEGARVVLYSLLLLGVLVGLGTLGQLFKAGDSVDAIRRAFNTLLMAVLIFPVIAWTGVVLLTRRGSVGYYEAVYLNRRFMLRTGAILLLALLGVIVVARFLPAPMQAVLLMTWAAAPPTLFLRGLSRLMLRLPNVKLAGFAQGVMLAYIAVGALTLLYLLLRPWSTNPEWRDALIALQVVVSWAWIFLGLFLYRLLLAVRRNFQAIRK